MKKKTCFKCSRRLPVTEFYRNAGMIGGLLGKCKDCSRAYSIEYRNRYIERHRSHDRERNRLPHRRADQVRKNKVKRATMGSDYDRSHNALNRAVASGKIVRPDHCTRCLVDGAPQAHHDDYSKPLDVMWLCPVCHAERHRELGRLGTNRGKPRGW